MRTAIFGIINLEPEKNDEFIHLDIHHFNSQGYEPFDRIICSNVIPELDRNKVMPFLEGLYNVLKPLGELVVHVPMAEFAAKSIFTNKMDDLAYFMLYGDAIIPFKCCYTMLTIRILLERAKFIVRSAGSGVMELRSIQGESVKMPIHSLIAVRRA